MRQQSFATRSIRRRTRAASRTSSRVLGQEQAALQVFVFRGETFLGTELFDATRPVMAGRHHDTTLRLDGETVSRYHARLSVVGQEIFVEDLDSGNGTLVNRTRIRGRTKLAPADQVHVGPYSLRIKLLSAPGPRPYDPSKSEDTTKINAILAAERTAGGETSEVGVGLEDSQPAYNESLYREALRRTTGGVRPKAPAPVEADAPARTPTPASVIEEDSTQMAADEVALDGEGASPVVLSMRDDESVEARLRDLDNLIASLEAEDRRGVSGPWANEHTAPTTSELDIEDAVFAPSAASTPADTREFARDLASRLALNGKVVEEEAPAKAEVIPLRPESRVPTPIPQAPLDDDDDPTEAELHEDPEPSEAEPGILDDDPTEAGAVEDLDPDLLAAAELDDDGPETDLLAGGVPPQIAPLIMSGPSVSGPSPVQERAEGLRDPAASGPARVPTKGLVIPKAPAAVTRGRSRLLDEPVKPRNLSRAFEPEPAPAPKPEAAPRQVAPAAVPSTPADVAPTRPAPAKTAAPKPPPLPSKRRRHHEARLMTPTSLRVGVTPMSQLDDSGLVEDVFTHGGAPSPAPAAPKPPPLPKRRGATEARPKSRMDDFSSAIRRLPDAPIPMHYDGVEVAARIGGQLVDISVLRKPGDEYILGHRTPQGAIAPARVHLGLRLVRINPDETIDLVFPRDVGGHLVRGQNTVTFSDLAEGRKYSSLRLENADVATVVLGSGKDTITYHVRFLRRPKSLFASLRGLRR